VLSKTEREYLLGKFQPTKNYEYKIIHSIRNKLKTFYQHELPLINSKSEVIGDRTSYLGKLTSYRARLTPRMSHLDQCYID